MLTALIVCISSVTFAAMNPFADVPSGHWAYNAVTNLANNGIISSYGDNFFLGNRNATRYEVAVMVANIYSKKTNTPITMRANPFSDLPSNHWAAKAVTTLAGAGIEEGYGDGTFLGNRNITRYELASLMANFIKSINYNIHYSNANPFSDVPKGHKNFDDVIIMVSNDIMEGYTDGTFRGNTNITRYEIAVLLDHVYNKLF